jgi:hypothetical protein
MISSNEKLAFHRIPAGMMEVIRRRWYHMSNALIVISYMTDYRYLAFVVVGSVIGTYLGVKIRKPKL